MLVTFYYINDDNSIEIFGINTINDTSVFNFTIPPLPYEAWPGYIYVTSDKYFILSEEYLFTYSENFGQILLIDSFPYFKKLKTDFNLFYLLKNGNYLFARTYNYTRTDDYLYNWFELIVFDPVNDKIIAKKIFDTGRNILLSYSANNSYIDVYDNKIAIQHPGTNIIEFYDKELKMLKQIHLNFFSFENTSDTIEKYLNDSILDKNFYNPKNKIEILLNNNLFQSQQIERLYYHNDSLLIATVKNLKMNKWDRQVFFINPISSEIKSTIVNISSPKIEDIFMVGGYLFSKPINTKFNMAISGEKSINEKTEEIYYSFNIIKRDFNKIVFNSFEYKDFIIYLYDYKNNPVKINKKTYKKIVFTDKYTCYSCYKYKDKILFIITNLSEANLITRLSQKKSILRKFPNSEVVFLNEKYTNYKKIKRRIKRKKKLVRLNRK